MRSSTATVSVREILVSAVRRGRLIAALSLSGALSFATSAQPLAQPGDPGVARYDGYQAVRVTVDSPRELLAVTSLMDSLFSESMGIGSFDVLLGPGKVQALRDLGVEHEILIANLQERIDGESARIRARLNGAGDAGGAAGEPGGAGDGAAPRAWFDDYKDLAAINAYMDALAASKPTVAKIQNVGVSVQGRTIRAIKISAPGDVSSRPAVLYQGCQHAREWVSPMTVMYLADRLVNGYGTDERVTALLNSAEVILVPVVNPDGYVYSWTNDRLWRKNRRNNGNGTFGVDLNRNWGFQWGGEGTSGDSNSDIYRGPSAFSEPETQAMRDFISANSRIRAHIDFHSYSQLILSPWGWTATLPPDHPTFNLLNGEMESAVESVFGQNYTSGPVYTTIYPASGGANDWSYGSRSILGWGWELRDTGTFGFVLPADQIVPTGQETLAAVLLLTEYVAYPFTYRFPQGVPEFVTADAAGSVAVDIVPRSGSVQAGTAKIFTKSGTGASFASSSLTALGGSAYSGVLPATECSDTIQFYFEAVSTDGRTLRSPANAPAGFYEAPAYQALATYNDPAEVNTGWTVGAPGDNATSGIWGLMDPEATTAQPGDDASAAGTRCWITDGRAGSSAGTYDVDNGTTTLTSPTFSAVENDPEFIAQSAVVRYSRWYSNNLGGNPASDSMPVLISNDNGANWTVLEDVTQNAGAWVKKEFRVSDFLTPTDQMKLRFQARDLGGGSLVEAGVDEVSLTLYGCPRQPADFDGNGFVDTEDFDAFVLAFEAGDLSADFDGTGFVDGDDFDAFVRAFEGG